MRSFLDSLPLSYLCSGWPASQYAVNGLLEATRTMGRYHPLLCSPQAGFPTRLLTGLVGRLP